MLQIFITNNIRIRGASTPLKADITKALTMDNPEYSKRLKRRQPTFGIEKKLQLFLYDLGDLVIPRGFKIELKELLRKHGINPEKVIVERLTKVEPIDFGPWNEKYVIGAAPREYQKPAVAAAVENDGVLVSPAGSGKTLMGCRYIYEKRQPALWLTHTKDLMYQAQENAYKYLGGVGKIGILGDGKKDWGSGNLIIATVQTLKANPHLVEALKPIIGTVVIDEAHHFPAPAFIEVAGQFPAAYMLGLTATPDRKDQLEKYMFTGIGPECYRVDRSNLYEAGSLVKPSVNFVYTTFTGDPASDRNDIDSVDAGGEDMDYTELMQRLLADERRAKQIAENILENAPNNYTIVLTESIRYCYKLRDIIERMAQARFGVIPRMKVIHGTLQRYKWVKNVPDGAEIVETKKDTKNGGLKHKIENYSQAEFDSWQISNSQRKEILRQGYNKEIDILLATQLAREGLDMPHLNVGHLATPKRGDAAGSNNGAAVEQEMGRIMRADPTNPDKKAIWYDYVDYEIGVFKDQYYSRRKVYKRLGIKLPSKPKTETEQIADFFDSMPW